MNNIYIKFWTLIGGIYSLICMVIFILYLGVNKNENMTITIEAEWGLVFLPVLLYLIWQFVYNYCELDEKNKE